MNLCKSQVEGYETCEGGITFWIDKVEEDSNLGGWVYIQTIGSRSLGIIPPLKANKLIEIFRQCPLLLPITMLWDAHRRQHLEL